MLLIRHAALSSAQLNTIFLNSIDFSPSRARDQSMNRKQFVIEFMGQHIQQQQEEQMEKWKNKQTCSADNKSQYLLLT